MASTITSTSGSQYGSTPVVIGVGDIKNSSTKLEDAVEPLDLMLQAIAAAIQDTTLSSSTAANLQSAIDSIDIVANWTWPYPNLPDRIAERLNVNPVHKHESEHGGHSPAKLFDEAARRVASQKCRVAVVTGGEALASQAALAAAKKFPPAHWTPLENVTSFWDRPRPKDLGTLHFLGLPTQIYAMYEAGLRAHLQQTYAENHEESSELYAIFARIAEKLPQSWSYKKPAPTAQSIGTATKKNRMICSPYPLLMNAFNNVNLAAACLVTSTEFARKLGVPESRWIYPLGGAGTSDAHNFWERANFYNSPSISKSIDAALQVSKLGKQEVDLFDFYSCFPIVPKLACRHLKLPLTDESRPVTVLGGLTSFGGAGNNYSMHAITQMVRDLRSGKGHRGLVLANGGVLSYHYTVCLSTEPRSDGSVYPNQNVLPPVVQDIVAPPITPRADGRAFIETYTVQFNRDGSPQMGYIIGRLKENGHRFVANAVDEPTLRQLCDTKTEQIGNLGWVSGQDDSEQNIFTFSRASHI